MSLAIPDRPRLMANPNWLTITAMGGCPALFLPDMASEVISLLDVYLREGEVVLEAGQLEELQAALNLLQVALGYQVHPICHNQPAPALVTSPRHPSLTLILTPSVQVCKVVTDWGVDLNKNMVEGEGEGGSEVK